MRIGLLVASAIFFTTVAAAVAAATEAQSAFAITRAVYVETRSDTGIALEPAGRLQAGDKVVLTMQWHTRGDARSFTLASKVPLTLLFQRSGDPSVEVSVDGGRRWGRLGALRREGRLAAPEEVTHLRWRIGAGDDRRLRSYSAIVR